MMMETSAATCLYGEGFYGDGVAEVLTGEMDDRRSADSTFWL